MIEPTKKRAVIRSGRIIYGDDISAEIIKPNETAARAGREDMKVRHRKEMLQKNQVDFYKAYPEQAKNLNDETRRLLS